MASNKVLSDGCPCSSGLRYAECCMPLISGQRSAAAPEALMRSRYSAFVLENAEYLVASTAEESRQADLRKRVEESMGGLQWLALHILAQQKAPYDSQGAWVEFAAFYARQSEVGQLHEKSFFVRRDQQWFYAWGEVLPERRWRRNEACWCRSGKKTKHCHGH